MPDKYAMSISLNVLHHLGINLYSNSVAVITEAVANSYDADADIVNIDIDTAAKTITISDDGIGMSVEEINQRFLYIGYDRRKQDSATTPKGRQVMGRKGLGKLSLFSIARKIEIYTKKDGITNAFLIDVDEIERQINESSQTKVFDYHPPEITSIPTNIITSTTGTKIVLRNLKSSRITSESQLRARLARRFSILGSKFGFIVKVNGHDISLSERQYYKKLQYIWIFGNDDYAKWIKDQCGTTLKRDVISDGAITGQPYQIKGWVATVANSGALKDDDSGNLNSVILLSRGRVIHENILDKFSDGRLYSKYLIGEINADFLDDNSMPDIATSSRQSLIEDDERYTTLTTFLKSVLSDIASKWTEFRNEDGVEEAVKTFPKIEEWLSKFKAKPDTKKAASKIIAHIQSLPVENDADKKELLKYGIIAFERLRLNDEMSKLDSLIAFDSDQFRAIVASVDEIEASLYHQIVKERIQIIRTLESLHDKNALEKEIQTHIFNHLWLLDPSWERAAGSEVIEQSVAKEFDTITSLTDEEKKGRLDIRYKKSAGAHVIIELKRSERKVTAIELYAQADKYRNALSKCLAKQNELTPSIEIVFLTGDQPIETHPGQLQQLFQGINARLMTYEQIVQSSLKSYTDYIEKNKEAGEIREIINSL